MFPNFNQQARHHSLQPRLNRRTSRHLCWLTGSTFLFLAAGSLPVVAQTVLFNEPFSGSTVGSPSQFSFGTSGGSSPPCLTAAPTLVAPPTSGSGVPGCDQSAVGSGTLPDPSGDGALRLTPNQGNQATFVLYNQPIPARSGLVITFDFFSYGGNGADGLSFFLLDGAVSPTSAGAFGGSLGYAPSEIAGVPGLAGGYVGIGFDEFGNFSNPIDQAKGGGGPGFIPDSVAIRGNAAGGYQYITGTGNGIVPSLPQSLDVIGDGVTRTTAQRTARITLTPTNQISVDIDFGAGFVNVIPLTTLTTPPPPTFKFGFAGSTGGSTNVHEIRNLAITTVSPNLSITKIAPASLTVGQQGSYTINVANSTTGGSTPDPTTNPNPVTVTDTLPPGLNFVSATGTNWSCAAVGQTVTCNYTGPVIKPGASATPITINVLPTGAAGASATNAAKVATVGDDPDHPPVPPNQNLTGDNTTSVVTSINSAVLLSALKKVTPIDANGNGAADPGEIITYTIDISNNGNALSTNTLFTDQIPGDTTYVPSSTKLNGNPIPDASGNTMPFSGNGALVNSIGTSLGQIPAGQTATVEFQVRINQLPNVTRIENQGSLASDQLTTPLLTDDPTVTGSADPTFISIGKIEIRLRLVKRVTQVNTTPYTTIANAPTDVNSNPGLWPTTLQPVGLAGLDPQTPLKSGDEVEYTIYFLSDGDQDVQNAKFCDLIPAGTTFIPNSFASNNGILLNQSGTQTPLTNASDTDQGTFFSTLTPVSAPCADPNNPNGAIFVQLGNVSHIAPSNVGLVRFRVRIN